MTRCPRCGGNNIYNDICLSCRAWVAPEERRVFVRRWEEDPHTPPAYDPSARAAKAVYRDAYYDRHKNDPGWIARIRERAHARYVRHKDDPEFRARKREAWRAWYHRQKEGLVNAAD